MKTSASAASEFIPETVDERELTVKESLLDTFGHVNNAKYLEILEQARWDLITDRGYGLRQVQTTKIGPVILEINLKFKIEVANREKIKIKTGVIKHSGKISTLRQIIINEKGQEACVADFVVGLFDLRSRKLIDYTPEWNRAIGLAPM